MTAENLKYTKTHEWVAVEGDTATIGISEFAVHLLSDLTYADLPVVGKKITQGQPFGEVESVKAVSDLYAPVSGEVSVADATELSKLLDHAAYQAHCETEKH